MSQFPANCKRKRRKNRQSDLRKFRHLFKNWKEKQRNKKLKQLPFINFLDDGLQLSWNIEQNNMFSIFVAILFTTKIHALPTKPKLC